VAWGAELPTAATAWLRGVGCPTGGADYFTTLRSLGAVDGEKLLAIAENASAPALVRQRAVVAAGRTLSSRTSIARISALAEDRSAPRAVRIGALRSMATASPAIASTLASRLEVDADPVVAAIAKARATF
jgi:hypothetical protein